MQQQQIILCGNLVPMTGDRVEGPQAVVVNGDRIESITPYRGEETPKDTPVLNFLDYTVLPGLIDAHSHLEMLHILLGNEREQTSASDATLALRAAKNALANLRAGITTMRLPGTKNHIDLALKQAILAGDLPGPRLVVAGRGIASSLTENVNQITADGPDAVSAAVRMNIGAGADFIKVFASGGTSPSLLHGSAPYLSEAELAAAVGVAQEFDLPVAAHAYGGRAIDLCLKTGVKQIEHGFFAEPHQFEKMAEQGVWLTGTLGVFLTRPGLIDLPGMSAGARERLLFAAEANVESVRQVKRAGVKFALGTDAIHCAIVQEAIFAAQAGLSNFEALAAITVNAAAVCKMEGLIGAIVPGAFADLIAVRGDPLSHLEVLKSPDAVIKDGKTISV
ncbi:amidohydrolase family protein [Ochrobactrum sp. CM-21-5]|nr:amidohydrolase family protein [Ochrobactrum sp. CM-21-5]MBC2887643.1 amidohydrolase family protein [Ochrobactrum sp. CM-21-5]